MFDDLDESSPTRKKTNKPWTVILSTVVQCAVLGGIIGGVGSSLPPPPKATPTRIRVGGQVQQASLISQPKPVYPALARQARIQGVVRLQAVIAKDGTVQELQVLSGHPLLVPSAMEAVRQWRYKPTLLNGEPVEVITMIDVNFVLGS